jgi:uncharacterized membrane protein
MLGRMNGQQRSGRSLEIGTARVQAFSDGVIAVIITIRRWSCESHMAQAIGSDIKGYASLVLYAAGVGFAFVSPWISYAFYVTVTMMWFIPDRRFTRAWG